jgi:hypothetical protein
MLRKLVWASAIVLALSVPALADSYTDLASWKAAVPSWTLVNFDTDPSGAPTVPGAPIGATYAAYGLDFPPGNLIEGGFGGPVSPPNGWINNTLVGSDRLFDVNMTVDTIFAAGVHNVFYGSWPNGAVLNAYGAGGGLLATVKSDGVAETLDFFGVTTTAPIKRVEILALNPGGWGLDDLYVGVPEPASAALLAVALLFARRR